MEKTLLNTSQEKLNKALLEIEMTTLSANNNIEGVIDLINSGATPDAKDQIGRSALTYACINSHLEMVRILLEKGANPNIQDIYLRETALFWAVKNKQVEIIKLLLDHGADPNLKNKEGATVFNLAYSAEIINALKNQRMGVLDTIQDKSKELLPVEYSFAENDFELNRDYLPKLAKFAADKNKLKCRENVMYVQVHIFPDKPLTYNRIPDLHLGSELNAFVTIISTSHIGHIAQENWQKIPLKKIKEDLLELLNQLKVENTEIKQGERSYL